MPILDCTTGEVRQETLEELANIEAGRVNAVPAAVSARQIKLALLGAGVFDDIEAFVATQDRDVRISWEYATEFLRSDPMLNAGAKAFGMTDEQIDAMFRRASEL